VSPTVVFAVRSEGAVVLQAGVSFRIKDGEPDPVAAFVIDRGHYGVSLFYEAGLPVNAEKRLLNVAMFVVILVYYFCPAVCFIKHGHAVNAVQR
ncbi:hypothetical protein, partial [Klebsiella pneumoniae]|uniref:hypothetical protein n=1 Tax=Klebsiella pneumoniae TaxID=573 RepID=UPI001BA7853F